MTDWAAWSSEAVRMAQARNAEWPVRWGIQSASYQWDLDAARITFTEGTVRVAADLCVVGTLIAEEQTFHWGWADASLPHASVCRLSPVRKFGEANDLGLLTTPVLQGGHAQALECACIASRLLDASGVFVDSAGSVSLYLTLHDFRSVDIYEDV